MQVYIMVPNLSALELRNRAQCTTLINKINQQFSESLEIIPESFESSHGMNKLEMIHKHVDAIAKSDMVLFAPGWADTFIGRIDYQVARELCKKVMLFDDAKYEGQISATTRICNMSFEDMHNQLTVLFAKICTGYTEAWKSHWMHDGTMYQGMFVVGLPTPEGTAALFCDIDLWDNIDVAEVEYAPEFDDGTVRDAALRIVKL